MIDSIAAAPRSIADQVRDAFPFSVDKFRLSGPEGLRTEWFGLFRSDTGETVGDGSVSAKYLPHTVEDVALLVQSASDAFGGELKMTTAWRDGHSVILQPTKEDRLAIFGTKDNIFPRVIVHAGYGGKAFQASIGWYRDVCRNLHIMRSLAECSANIRHTRSLDKKVDAITESFRGLRLSWRTVGELVASMESKTVNLMEFLDRVYEETETKRDHKRNGEILSRLVNERRATDRPFLGSSRIVSVWEAFNAVQGHIQHDTRRKGDNRNPLARALLALDDPTVKRAELTALSMIA